MSAQQLEASDRKTMTVYDLLYALDRDLREPVWPTASRHLVHRI